MYKLLVIAPYAGLKELVSARAHHYKNFRIDIELGNLEQGVDIARKAQQVRQYDIIMSRGGTSQLIERETHVPVVDISVSSYDFLRVMHLARTVSGKVALVGFPNIIQSAATACDIQQIHIDMFPIQDGAPLEETLLSLSKKGYAVFVGDVVTVETAKRMGLHSILLTSGTESVDAAFAQAETILRHTAYFRERETLSTAILNTLQERVLLYDERRVCLFRSESVTDEDETLARERLSAAAPDSGGHSARIQAHMIEKNGRAYSLLRIARENARVQTPGVHFHHAHFQQAPFEYLNQSAEYMKEILDKARIFARTKQSILLVGANGTGRQRLAMAIYEASAFNRRPLVRLDCAAIAESGWRELFDPERSILPERDSATLYLQNLHRMPATAQSLLLSFLREGGPGDRFRLISSATGALEELVEREAFHYDLFKKLCEKSIALPPLRERAADIPNLIGFAIGGTNSKYGTQVIGMEPDAIPLLTAYHWPRNIDQFVEVVESLALSVEGHYIGAKSVEDALAAQPPRAGRALSLDKSLNEITQDVIKMVMEQEGGNQSAAAKRLGISRSTLWRKLGVMQDGEQ